MKIKNSEKQIWGQSRTNSVENPWTSIYLLIHKTRTDDLLSQTRILVAGVVPEAPWDASSVRAADELAPSWLLSESAIFSCRRASAAPRLPRPEPRRLWGWKQDCMSNVAFRKCSANKNSEKSVWYRVHWLLSRIIFSVLRGYKDLQIVCFLCMWDSSFLACLGQRL